MKPRTERIHCNGCSRSTEHLLIATRKNQESEPYASDPYDPYEVWSETIYDVFECCGCKDVSIRRTFFFSEWNPGEVETDYFPPRIGRRIPSWKSKLPKDLRSLLEEVYAALQAGSARLSMIGARALIDMVILQQVGDTGTFKEKLKSLETEGFISKKNRGVLEAALDVGNAASHRGHCPEDRHVQNVMDIVENLLQATLLQEVVDELKEATPQRVLKKKARRNSPKQSSTDKPT